MSGQAEGDQPGLGDIAAPKAGQIVFYDRHEPPLMAGGYSLAVSHQVKFQEGRDKGEAIDKTYSQSYKFFVRGERLRLDPGELQGVFPPRDSQGEFGNVLPHVVFARATLPWERSPRKDGGDANGASWLALLTFDDWPDAPAPKAAQVRMKDLSREPGSTLPKTIASYFDASGGNFAPQVGESWDDPCLAIDLRVAVFTASVPSLEDLRWLAHVRTTSLDRKAGPDQGATSNAVLVGARLARTQQAGKPKPFRTVVHMVSLEHMAEYLPSDGTYAAKPIFVDGTRVEAIRLISLASWSFASVDPKVSFTGYMKALSASADALRRPGNPMLAAGDPVGNALAMGYTALPHRTRLGDQATSWFRGPLAPYDANAAQDPSGAAHLAHIPDADAALAFDPKTGMFDVSGAAAWQLGRMLILQARDTALALANYKQAAARSAVAAHLEQHVQPSVTRALSLSGLRTAISRPAPGPPPLLARAAGLVAATLAGKGATGGATALPATEPRSAGRLQAFAALNAARADPVLLAQAHNAVPRPQSVIDWLARLATLKGVPLAYLVPDPALLPPESIRFFHLDLAWVIALLEGAGAVGRATSAGADLDAAGIGGLRDAALAQAGIAGGASGLLLRSAAVGVWPTMEFAAYAGPNGSRIADADVIRHEIIAPDLMLFLCKGSIARLEIHEPSEGLHFGVDHEDRGKKPLRNISGREAGLAAEVPYRDTDKEIVATALLAKEVGDKLGRHPISAAEFALELVEGVQSFAFEIQEAKGAGL